MPQETTAANDKFRVFRCRDMDEQAAVLSAWNQSYCQLSPGAFDGGVTAIDTGPVHLVAERLNRAVLQRGALPPDCVAVGIPLQLEGHSQLCGQRSHLDGLHVFSGADGFEFRSPEQHLMIDIELYPKRFSDPALRATVERLASKLSTQATVVDLPDGRLAPLRHVLRTILDAIRADPTLLAYPPSCAAFEKSVVYALANLLDDEPWPVVTPGASRNWRLVQAARDVLEKAASDCPLSVAELVTQLGVSRRSLQYAFQEALGMNPAAYLRTERLNRVRRALGNTESVTEAATRFGFWHFSHFAKDYRTLFAELPSDTCRRRRQESHPHPPHQNSWRPDKMMNLGAMRKRNGEVRRYTQETRGGEVVAAAER